jgi:hypothetical protein
MAWAVAHHSRCDAKLLINHCRSITAVVICHSRSRPSSTTLVVMRHCHFLCCKSEEDDEKQEDDEMELPLKMHCMYALTVTPCSSWLLLGHSNMHAIAAHCIVDASK